jgi:predicted RNA-binding Zn ribbon-like protein
MIGDEMTHEAQAAPGSLETVREFVNTYDIEPGTDELGSPDELLAWLHDHDLMPHTDGADEADLALAIRTRESLRSLLWANNGETVAPHAVEFIDDVAARAKFRLRFRSPEEANLEAAAGGVTGALGRLLTIVAAAMNDGTWSRLKACRNEECGWAFYDHARNRSGKWCTMAVCGNRMKARAFRARHAESGS